MQYTEETQAYTMINDLLRELPQIEALYISQSRMAEAVLGSTVAAGAYRY
ncbi:MAG: hypothetical protein ACLTY5_11365 [Angelakisella sp.]